MLNKSRHQSATAQRQYDIPGASYGASLRGPYKRWIPQTDNRFSESETEAPPKSSSHRTRTPHGSSSHVAVTDTSYSPAPTSTSRSANPSLSHLPPSQSQRSERTLYGYSSESTVHAPPPPSKHVSSSFNPFKHASSSRTNPTSTARHEELPRSTAAPAAVPSRHHTQPIPVPQGRSSRDVPVSIPGAIFGSLSTQTSTDPSPRSSTDSGHRNGHVSAPAAEHRHGHTIWNPYVDTRLHTDSMSRKSEATPGSSRRDDKKLKDKEDMVARVTEALGGGSTGKAKAVETALLQGQLQPVKPDDASSARRTTSSTGSRALEPQSRTQAQPTLRRTKDASHVMSFSSSTHLPEALSKSSRPTTSSRTNPELLARAQAPPEPTPKPVPITPKTPTSSTPTSKLPHSRTTSSPWPFNQALPTEHITPKLQPPPQSQPSSGWRSFPRFHGSSSTTKTPDVRSPPKDAPSHQQSPALTPDHERVSQTSFVPPPNKSLPRGTTLHGVSSRVAPLTPAPTPIAITQSQQHNSRSRYDTNPSYATMSSESTQRRIPNTSAPGKSASSSTVALQTSGSYQASMTPSTKPPDTRHDFVAPNEPTVRSERYLTCDVPPIVPTDAQPSAIADKANIRQLESVAPTPWPTIKHTEMIEALPVIETTSGHSGIDATSSITIPKAHTQTPFARPAPLTSGSQPSQSNLPQSLWLAPTRRADTAITAPVIHDSTIDQYATSMSQMTISAPAGAWTSNTSVSQSSGEVLGVSRGLISGSGAHIPQTVSRSNPPTPPEQDSPGQPTCNDTVTQSTARPGAWTTKYLNANVSATTPENVSTPKPSIKATIPEVLSSTAKYTPTNNAAAESLDKGPRFNTSNPVHTTVSTAPTPGAWTTSTKLVTNTSGSIFDTPPSTKYQTSGSNVREASTPARQATLGTTPTPGAWTTKTTTTTTAPAPSSSNSTPRQTPPRNPSPQSSSLLKPPPPSGTGTGSSTPSSTQVSDAATSIVTSHTISTRVPISGHPSTPAPVRPVLRPTPPPLSISSTSPDTDSLLTPSSLNSPRSTIALPPVQPVTTATPAPALEKDKKERKGGFFGFLRPKPPVYEVWTPPNYHAKEKERKHEEPPKDAAPAPSKSKPSASVPVPRPKSPKIFSPFKMFSKRHRTVSTASLDVLDGTAPNTVMNSPASSMRADTPGAPPSPPLRDASLATQEWRNKEATELIVSGRKRRHRPGVTFDCPEDIAPADILPSRIRVARLVVEDDDDY